MSEQVNEGIISFKWNNHMSTFFSALSSLRAKEFCTDATLGCDGKLYPIHKLVLCSSSDYFCDIFEKTNCKSPVIILKDIHHHNLESLLDYMYHGEVEVRQNDLPDLLQAAECLRIKGLAVPDDLNLTPSKDISSVEKIINYSPIGNAYNPNSPLTSSPIADNVSDSDEVMKGKQHSLLETGTPEPPLKRVKLQVKKNITKNGGNSNMPSVIPGNFCEALNAIEVPLKSYTSSHITSNWASDSSSSFSSETKPDQTYVRNISLKKLKSNGARKLRLLPRKQSVMKKKKKDCQGKPLHSLLSEVQNSNSNTTRKQEQNSPSGIKNNEINVESKDAQKKKLNTKEASNKLKSSQPSTCGSSMRKVTKGEQNNQFCEAFFNEIGLPIFSEQVKPYIEGHELELSEKSVLFSMLIDQLAEHFKLYNIFEKITTVPLRSTFYHTLQKKMIEKYPKIFREESTWKKSKKGPLSLLVNRLSVRMCSFERSKKGNRLHSKGSSSTAIEKKGVSSSPPKQGNLGKEGLLSTQNVNKGNRLHSKGSSSTENEKKGVSSSPTKQENLGKEDLLSTRNVNSVKEEQTLANESLAAYTVSNLDYSNEIAEESINNEVMDSCIIHQEKITSKIELECKEGFEEI